MSTTTISTQKTPIVLIGFIALSVLAHGLLFLLQTSPQNRLVQNSWGAQKLSISLISAKISVNTSTDMSPAIKTQISKQLPEQIAVAKKSALAVSKTSMISPEKIKQTQQQATHKTTQRNFLLGEIQHRLSRYLSYPVRAQRRGWQGEVMVAFHVDKQGFLHNVHLTQTSGYSLLDNAALSAIGKVKNIPLSSWLEDNHENEFHPTALQLPVSYRLTNS